MPPRLRSKMKVWPTLVAPKQTAKMDLVATRVRALRTSKRPVLIGARSVAASEMISETLTMAGIAHEVLNALEDEKEASIIASAGRKCRVTVVTNMAGRGVHIDIPTETEATGGLHVILTERHDSTRIDRQLQGRTVRQGQCGSFEVLLARDDAILEGVRTPIAKIIGIICGPPRILADRMRFRKAQRLATKLNTRARRALLDHDRHLEKLMAFSGGRE